MLGNTEALTAETRRPARAEVAILLTCAIVAAGALGIVLRAARPRGEAALARATHTVEVVVASGDTLWSIAREHVGRDVDLRAAVDDIVARNRLSSTILRPGQVLVVAIDPRMRCVEPPRQSTRRAKHNVELAAATR
ncbi:MAG: LysM peptidoglycan-binding domain-containing protein [Firmicutes bacterium]|jgi:nucleoid-associated protein YgaU|nr:LysM peptidoglycan-binding domain-containing protein [Bacillota bacterium]MDH7496527.1 LysM peptidoglycan-binding domain-containing protein [Bacillota bacterium]